MSPNNQAFKISRTTRNLLAISILVSVASALTAWSWRKWPDILVDFGHELYIPWQITLGKVLYKDMMFSMGPVSQYFNALLFSIFGVSLDTLIVANLAILAIITLLIYVLFARICDYANTIIIGVVFLTVFAFSQYVGVGNYNYICPYRHETTHGLLFCLLLVTSLVRYADSAGRWMIFSAGTLTALTFLTKSEFFVASTTICLTAAVILVQSRKIHQRNRIELAFMFIAGGFIALIGFLLLLWQHMPFIDSMRALTTNAVLTVTDKVTIDYKFYIVNLGLDDIPHNLFLMTRSLFYLGIAVGFAAATDRIAGQRFRESRFAVVGITVIMTLIGIKALSYDDWSLTARSLPAVCALSFFYFLSRCIANRDDDVLLKRYYLLTLWSSMSFVLLLKMLLRPRFDHYGYVLAMPGTLLLVALVISIIPTLLRRRHKGGQIFRAVMTGLTFSAITVFLGKADSFYTDKELALGKPGDQIFTYRPEVDIRGFLVGEAMKELEATMPGTATLMVLPEGITMNYLLRRTNPTPYYLLTPWEMAAYGGEAMILDKMQSNQPDFVAILNINMRDHGRGLFGDPEYGQKIIAWIDADYKKFKTFNLTPHHPDNFGISLYRRQ